MKLITLSNYFNHHQKPLSDALYSLLGEDYHFVETEEIPAFRRALGYKEMSAPYVIQYNNESKNAIDRFIIEADAVIYGEAPLSLIKKRLSLGKLTLRDDECRYRSLSRFLKWPIYTYNSLYLNKGYLLCASAFGPIDYILSGMNPKKCFKWGYFPEVKQYEGWDTLYKKKSVPSKRIRILWCGRLIPLKHPESLVYVAERLRLDGYVFELHVIGTGKLENRIKNNVHDKQLESSIFFHGSMKPEDVRAYMEESDIFLFTSDRNEGWGAVLNESMNSGCAVVAGSNIGSVPYLINDGENGLIYKDLNWEDLYRKVRFLIDNPDKREYLGEQAYKTITEVWNGDVAARNLLSLCVALSEKLETPIQSGPCSIAPLQMRRWHGRFKML